MKTQFLVIIVLLCFSCKNDSVEKSKDSNAATSAEIDKTGNSNIGQKTFGETAEDFLESLGGNEELKNNYLEKLKAVEKMGADSTEIGKMYEALMNEAIQREHGEGNPQEKRQKMQSGNMDDLTAAFERLNAESGVEATIDKLKKVDSITEQNSFEVLGLDQKTIDKMSEKTKSSSNAPNKESVAKERMTYEEMDMIRAFSQANSNVHNTVELDKLQQVIESSNLNKMAAENKITKKYAQMQSKEFERIEKHLARKQQEVTNAQKSFKKRNPDLYFDDEVGMTYFGNMGKAVYLPLGKLSFADQVISSWHPDNINTASYTIGEPDAYTTGMNSAMNVYSMGLKGKLVVKFEDNALVDVNGPDLYIFELGKIEPTNLEISKDGKIWISVGKISGGVAEVDIHDFVERDELFYYVRLTDLETSSGIPGADIDAIAAIGSAVRLNLDSQVLFDTGKSDLKPSSKKALETLAESVKVLQRGNVIVEGHTDNVGNAKNNKQLSLARAKSVSTALKKLLQNENFTWREKGLGEEKPLVENDTDSNRAKNRRVEILVMPN